ncbi:hypothetical protein BpHYR1_013242 [Brachionus plicatilis]|uniref:Uncharacterized protein n=1 Tax=Brachionus plicatilis TaxID=10195 RepID=A0A3M7S195_BRAPC|nr:hypothetical protein BpHYR1_013242 [Brachionus plicatilis]
MSTLKMIQKKKCELENNSFPIIEFALLLSAYIILSSTNPYIFDLQYAKIYQKKGNNCGFKVQHNVVGPI